MRFIVSVELAIPVVERLVLLQEELNEPIQASHGAVRWTAPEHLRLNLMIFPSLETGTVQRLQETLSALAQARAPLPFMTRGTDARKVQGSARLVTTRVDQGSDALQELQQALNDEAEATGYESDPRPWTPRILLGRLATPHAQVSDFDTLFAPYEDTAWGETRAQELVLYRSEIVGKSERIRVVKRFALGSGI